MTAVYEVKGKDAGATALNRKISETAAKIAAPYTAAEKAARRFNAQVERLRSDLRTPMEKFRERLHVINAAFTQGSTKWKQAIANARVETGLVVDALVQVDEEATSAFDVLRLIKYQSAISAVSAAIRTSIELLREQDRQAKENLQTIEQSADEFGRLGQLGAPDRALALNIFRRGATETIGDAARLVFQAQSAGFDPEDTRFIAGLSRAGLIRSGESAQLIEGLQRLRASSERDLSVEQLSNQLFRASEEASAGVTEIAAAAARAAPSAREIGISQEATIAGAAILSRTLGAAEAGTALRSFLREAQERGVEAGDERSLQFATEFANKLAQEFEGEGRFIQRTEAASALSNLLLAGGQVGTLTREIQAATDADIADLRAQENLRESIIAGRLSRRIADADLLFARETQAVAEAREQAVTQASLARLAETREARRTEGALGIAIQGAFQAADILGVPTQPGRIATSGIIGQQAFGSFEGRAGAAVLGRAITAADAFNGIDPVTPFFNNNEAIQALNNIDQNTRPSNQPNTPPPSPPPESPQ